MAVPPVKSQIILIFDFFKNFFFLEGGVNYSTKRQAVLARAEKSTELHFASRVGISPAWQPTLSCSAHPPFSPSRGGKTQQQQIFVAVAVVESIKS